MSQDTVPSDPRSLSRRNVLELGAAALVGLVAPWGCSKSAPAPKPKPQGSVTPPLAMATSASNPKATSGCSASVLPLGQQVPFSPKDRAFGADAEDFDPKRRPQAGDWMARFEETGLTFDEYVASRPTQRNERRNILVLQPLGRFRGRDREQLGLLAKYTEAFFDTAVRIADPAALPQAGQRSRQGAAGSFTQHHTRTILRWMTAMLPPDAVCVLGITMDDLYPEPSWNYVFGEATLEKRVGVYSLARYQARFWGKKATESTRKLAILRSFKVLAHETGHMFSLEHCRRYECLMNGSNSLEEMDRAPVEPCPVCLKMLQYNLRFDIRSRYLRLMAIYEETGLTVQRDWVQRRLERIGCG